MELEDGLKTLNNTVSSLKDSTTEESIKKLAAGLSTAKKGMTDASDGMTSAANGMTNAAAGINSAAEGINKAATTISGTADTPGASNYIDQAAGIKQWSFH